MEFTHVLRGLLGLAAFIGLACLFSANRKAIPWRVVGAGLGLQLVLALLILQLAPVRSAFDFVGGLFVRLLGFTAEGSRLLFGWLYQVPTGGQGVVVAAQDGSTFATHAPIFAISILPSIIFFSALTTLLYRLGVLQWVVKSIAWVMAKTLRLSGPETLSASGNIFLGQTEAPLLIKPFLPAMTKSELLAVMIGGMSTIAGGVMAVYITLLGGDDPVAQTRWASHLLTASVLSAPAALVIAKILLPETEPVDSSLVLNAERPGANWIDAVCLGTGDGLKLAVNVGGMLIVFTALVALANALLNGGLGEWTGLNAWIATATDGRFNGLTLQFLLGVLGAPLAWLAGVDAQQMLIGGSLLGEKVVLNEFIAYFSMAELQASGQLVDERSRLILTYALCGFSNLVSIGIQVGGLGAMAPGRRSELAQLGFRALLGGNLACLLTASFAGMLS